MNLIIGIGNSLRGDDGVGPWVVDAVPARPGLETMTVHQLTPELVETMGRAERVLFVDAALHTSELDLGRVLPAPHRGVGHACTPAALLGWCELLEVSVPETWLLAIPAASFELGESLSERTRACVPEALIRIEAWLDQVPEPVLVMNEEEA